MPRTSALKIKPQDTRPLVEVKLMLHPDIIARLDQNKKTGPREYLVTQALNLTLPELKNGTATEVKA